MAPTVVSEMATDCEPVKGPLPGSKLGVAAGGCGCRHACRYGAHGAKRLSHLRPEDIDHLFTKKIKTPAAANNWLRMVRMLMKFAVSKKMIASDPTADIKALQNQGR